MIERFTNTFDLNASLAEALNLISTDIEHHHQQTAYMAYMIARAADLDDRMLELVHIAALAHDLGFITMEVPGSIEELERDAVRIAEAGAKLIEGFPDAEELACIVRFWKIIMRSLTLREMRHRESKARDTLLPSSRRINREKAGKE